MTAARPFVRSRHDRMIGGVLGGIARRFGWNSTVLRVLGVAVVAGLLGHGVLIVTDDLFGDSVAGSLGELLVGTVVISVATLAGLVVARVPELREPLAAVRGRLGRG